MIVQPGQTHAVCSDCEKELPLERFTVNNRRAHPDGSCRYNQCKKCRWDRHSDRRTKNYHEAKQANPRIWFYSNLSRKYGLTVAQVDALLVTSSGLCAVCGNQFRNSPKEPHLDHNHKTGKVREFLCTSCNTMVGHLEKTWLAKLALAYVKAHR